MQTYYIFDEDTDTLIGEVLAVSVADAEYIAAGAFFDHPTNRMYALSANNF